jgi:hypothetical protein
MRYIYRKVWRRNGKFISMGEARRHPETCTVERIPCRVGRRRRPVVAALAREARASGPHLLVQTTTICAVRSHPPKTSLRSDRF